MRKLCCSTKFPHQEIKWNYSMLRSVHYRYFVLYYAQKHPPQGYPRPQFSVKNVILFNFAKFIRKHTWKHTKLILKEYLLMDVSESIFRTLFFGSIRVSLEQRTITTRSGGYEQILWKYILPTFHVMIRIMQYVNMLFYDHEHCTKNEVFH